MQVLEKTQTCQNELSIKSNVYVTVISVLSIQWFIKWMVKHWHCIWSLFKITFFRYLSNNYEFWSDANINIIKSKNKRKKNTCIFRMHFHIFISIRAVLLMRHPQCMTYFMVCSLQDNYNSKRVKSLNLNEHDWYIEKMTWWSLVIDILKNAMHTQVFYIAKCESIAL